MNCVARVILTSKPQLMLIALLWCCVSCKQQVLFTHSSPNPNAASDSFYARVEKILMPDDKIMISVWDHDDLSVGSLQSVYSLQEEYGKWLMIDSKGEIKLPQAGTIKIAGMNLHDATAAIEKAYSKFIQNPNVNMRLLNNEVTLLGEVRSQGNYIFSADNIRLTELIGKAQGLTDYAKAKDIHVIRGEKQFSVNLKNTTAVSDQSLIIYPGDVVYVPPAGNKNFDRFSSKLIPIASLITAIGIFYSITKD